MSALCETMPLSTLLAGISDVDAADDRVADATWPPPCRGEGLRGPHDRAARTTAAQDADPKG